MAPDSKAPLEDPHEPSWPGSAAQPVVFLVDAASPLEERLLASWIDRTAPRDAPDWEIVRLPPSRRRRGRLDPGLELALASGNDALLAPLRVAWLAPFVGGQRTARLRDLLTFGDPRDPGRLRQAWIRSRHPDRVHVIAGEPARVSELRTRWGRAGGSDPEQTTGLPEFVARQAALALDRAERRVQGSRYKVPRFVFEEILSRPAFRSGSHAIAREQGLSDAAAAQEAARNLKEIAATHSPFVIDLVANLIRLLYTQGYGESLRYDHDQLADIAALAQRNPVVFLPTHKSNLDHLVLQYALHENGLPPNHTAGGINLNFFPLGQLVRRSGVFFIRRSFKDAPLYKHVLRGYIDYLIEKRFSLEWYIEGGRSRSGKLLPPRFGLLAYVVDAYRRAKSEDVLLIPVSIAYDQIQDVGSYVAEQRGGAKEKEGFGWFVRVIRSLRKRYGDIHIRFGAPVSLREQLGPPNPEHAPGPDEQELALQKLAFEVSVRINAASPITENALVTMAMLGSGNRALSAGQTCDALCNLLSYVEHRKLPTTTDLSHLGREDGVRGVLAALQETGVVSCYADGREPVYQIGPDQQLQAAYYRNGIVHFFVNRSICEIALLAAAERDGDDPVSDFWNEAMRLRDLLKFEFFFAEKDRFREELIEELSFNVPNWESIVRGGAREIVPMVRNSAPSSAHRALRPFLEAYQLVSDELERWNAAIAVDESAVVDRCLALGKQYQLQESIHSTSSVSKVLFQTALQLARHRGLLESDDEGLSLRRAEFASEVRDAVRRANAVDALAASRREGVSF